MQGVSYRPNSQWPAEPIRGYTKQKRREVGKRHEGKENENSASKMSKVGGKIWVTRWGSNAKGKALSSTDSYISRSG